MTANPPFSCFNRSTKLRLLTTSQSGSISGALGIERFLLPARPAVRAGACRRWRLAAAITLATAAAARRRPGSRSQGTRTRVPLAPAGAIVDRARESLSELGAGAGAATPLTPARYRCKRVGAGSNGEESWRRAPIVSKFIIFLQP